MNRFSAKFIRLRYERKLTSNIVKGPYHNWSIEEDKILIDCLFKDSSLKNPKDISRISKQNVRDSKADEKINRSADATADRWSKTLRPLLLQYHFGAINTPWKYSVLKYICEKKLMESHALTLHMTEINKHFPWLDILSISSCYRQYYTTEIPFYDLAKSLMEKYKDRPAHSEKALERCEEIIEYYDPKGELSEYKFCKIHDKCLKSHGCGSL